VCAPVTTCASCSWTRRPTTDRDKETRHDRELGAPGRAAAPTHVPVLLPQTASAPACPKKAGASTGPSSQASRHPAGSGAPAGIRSVRDDDVSIPSRLIVPDSSQTTARVPEPPGPLDTAGVAQPTAALASTSIPSTAPSCRRDRFEDERSPRTVNGRDVRATAIPLAVVCCIAQRQQPTTLWCKGAGFAWLPVSPSDQLAADGSMPPREGARLSSWPHLPVGPEQLTTESGQVSTPRHSGCIGPSLGRAVAGDA
jgi:hypothetical protein